MVSPKCYESLILFMSIFFILLPIELFGREIGERTLLGDRGGETVIFFFFL